MGDSGGENDVDTDATIITNTRKYFVHPAAVNEALNVNNMKFVNYLLEMGTPFPYPVNFAEWTMATPQNEQALDNFFITVERLIEAGVYPSPHESIKEPRSSSSRQPPSQPTIYTRCLTECINEGPEKLSYTAPTLLKHHNAKIIKSTLVSLTSIPYDASSIKDFLTTAQSLTNSSALSLDPKSLASVIRTISNRLVDASKLQVLIDFGCPVSFTAAQSFIWMIADYDSETIKRAVIAVKNFKGNEWRRRELLILALREALRRDFKFPAGLFWTFVEEGEYPVLTKADVDDAEARGDFKGLERVLETLEKLQRESEQSQNAGDSDDDTSDDDNDDDI
ncbi:hypothetical protein HDU76_003877 [Blyttiomyces sp. JEL0837]|nr:hypothetical protein HDU76_003877 [Blyttiomyces sp. JEL0837]